MCAEPMSPQSPAAPFSPAYSHMASPSGSPTAAAKMVHYFDLPTEEKVTLRYVVTYGAREVFRGEKTCDALLALSGLLAEVFDEHRDEVVNANGGNGGWMSELYREFTTRSKAIRVSASNFGAQTVLADAGTPCYKVVAKKLHCVRFHLDELEYLSQGNYVARIRRLCAHYNPRLAVVLDRMLAAAKGCEDKLLRSLVEHYGPEPTGNDMSRSHRARLVAFYKQYNPQQLGRVDEVLREFKGSEEELFSGLVAKYGPEPPPTPGSPPQARAPVMATQPALRSSRGMGRMCERTAGPDDSNIWNVLAKPAPVRNYGDKPKASTTVVAKAPGARSEVVETDDLPRGGSREAMPCGARDEAALVEDAIRDLVAQRSGERAEGGEKITRRWSATQNPFDRVRWESKRGNPFGNSARGGRRHTSSTETAGSSPRVVNGPTRSWCLPSSSMMRVRTLHGCLGSWDLRRDSMMGNPHRGSTPHWTTRLQATP